MKLIFLVIILILGNVASACPNLVGTWKSSREMSMAYNEKFAHLELKQIELLNQILGHLRVSYTENSAHEYGVPNLKIKIGNKKSDFEIEDSSYQYKILSCSDTEITINYEHPYLGEITETFNFVNADIYWASSEMLPSSREYFIRESK